MDSYITDERNGLNYKLVGDYYLPMIKAPETPKIGIWGQRHYQYLKENRPTTVNVMRMNGTLNSYLREVDEQADEMCYQLVKQLAKQEGVTEALKRQNQMAWVGAMNIIRERVEEIVSNQIFINNCAIH